jgi:hypothetical protein
LKLSDRPVGCLARPARFERATYVLDEVALVKLDN